MPHFRKKPVVIEAHRWFKNGDHPLDYASDVLGLEKGELKTFSGEYCRQMDWEGQLVRRYRRPDIDGNSRCQHCKQTMHVHGWMPTLEAPDGFTVCPGDWIITGVKGEMYPCKHDIFFATYEPVTEKPMSEEKQYAPPPITGYRSLSQTELDLMNDIKALGPDIKAMIDRVEKHIALQNELYGVGDAESMRWTRISQDHFQQALMALTRAVARPAFF